MRKQPITNGRGPALSLAALAGIAIVVSSCDSSPAVPPEQILTDIQYLADEAQEGRGLGTAGLDASAAYIANRFGQVGLQPVDDGGYLQEFVLDSTAPALVHSGIGAEEVKNVVGIIPGRGALANQAVVIGAHYDHLGLGGSSSLDPDSTGVVHNGADDNASGTAAIIEVARLLAERSAADQRTIVFVAFTGEETGLLGSDYYVKNPVVSNDSTFAMINFDMVGRLRENTLIAIGTGSATEMPMLLDSVNAESQFELATQEDPWGRSDHSSFYGASMPVVHLFTDSHEDYHRPTDDIEKLDLDGVVRISEYAADLTWAFATRQDRLTFVDVPRPAPTGMGNGASLGSIPDMSGSPGGVRLNGVRAGSAADEAGLLAGDILVQLGDHEVADLYGMTAALGAYSPGDRVRIVVLRDGERIDTAATLGRRGG